MYAIIDLETTGGNAKSDKIIEIAIVLHNGEAVEEEFSTLINPERRVPYRITGITGINDVMVKGSPKFYEIARRVVEMTEGRILVAHNARFDYQFLRNAFKELGYDYKRDVLCTLTLSRKLLPGQRSHSLKNLCLALDIPLPVQHRALEDTRATIQLLEILLKMKEGDPLALGKAAPGRMGPEASLHKEMIDALPHTTGVYYFYNARRDLIYIGKSVNIRSRILSHFSNQTTSKALEMKGQIDHIRYEETGSELVALLKESEEIKQYKPIYNRAQRRSVFNHGIFSHYNEEGYLQLRVERLKKKGAEAEAAFASAKEAKGFLERMLQNFELCQRHLGIHRLSGPCFYHSIHKCRGACVGKEGPESYNLRVDQVLQKLRYQHVNMLIMDRGRHENEKSLVGVVNGKYLGYGFLESELVDNDPQLLLKCLHAKMDNRDVRQIIKLFLRQEKPEQILTWE